MSVLDCTFLSRDEARRVRRDRRRRGRASPAWPRARRLPAARRATLRGHCGLLVAGGPLPTCEPEAFLGAFDVVVRGEGEQTMVELLAACAAGATSPGARRRVRAPRGAARRARSARTSTPSPSRPATSCPTPSTSATAGAATASR